MSATPIRRRVRRGAALAVVSLLMLAGCTAAQRPPSSYSGAEDNFIEGCVNIAKSDDTHLDDKGQKDTVEIASPKTYCQCVFDAISGKNGVPYSEFKSIQSRMQDEGGPLPESFQKAYDSCDPAKTSGS